MGHKSLELTLEEDGQHVLRQRGQVALVESSTAPSSTETLAEAWAISELLVGPVLGLKGSNIWSPMIHLRSCSFR